MKKVLAIVAIVALMGVVGCPNTSFLCKNKDAILAGLQFVINQADSNIATIEAQYPGVIPPVVASVLAGFQAAKNAAQKAAAEVCPTAAELTAAQGKMTVATQNLALAVRYQGLKLGK